MTDWDVRASGAGTRITWLVKASTPSEALREALTEAERTSVTERPEPAMPSQVDLTMTVREDGMCDGRPVVVLTVVDVTGDRRQLHLSQEVAMGLLSDLAVAARTLARGGEQIGRHGSQART